MNKYNAVRSELDGIFFDSKRERDRYWQLKMLVRAKKIDNLILQPSFDIVVNTLLICKYIADFSYRDLETGTAIVEDCKGVLTDVYKLKKKLVSAVYGIDIKET